MWQQFARASLRMGLVIALLAMGAIAVNRLLARGRPLVIFANNQKIIYPYDVVLRDAHAAPIPYGLHGQQVCQPFHASAGASNAFYHNIGGGTSKPRPLWLESYSVFHGWSNTGTYLADRLDTVTQIWDAETQTVLFRFEEDVNNIWWSPRDDYVALLAFHPQGTQSASVALVDVQTRRVSRIPLPHMPARYSVWGKWAPDADHFFLAYTDPSQRYHLQQFNTASPTQETISTQLYRNTPEESILITEDVVRYWQETSNVFYLTEYDTNTGAQHIIRTASRPPVLHMDNAAVYYDHPDGTHSIHMIDRRTMAQVPLISHADDLGDPNVRTDNLWIAAVYDANEGEPREMRVAWMQTDGSGYREYKNDAYVDIRHLVWAPLSDRLAFVGIYPDDTYTLHIANLYTGELTTPITRTPDLIIGKTTSTHVHQWYAYSDDAGGWHWLALNEQYETQYNIPTDVYVNAFQEQISPDGQHTLLKLHGASPKRYLVLLDAGQITATPMRDDLIQNGGLAWGPNSARFLAVAEIGRHNSEALIYNADGKPITRFPNPNGTWLTCP